jgi:hypothetical protein
MARSRSREVAVPERVRGDVLDPPRSGVEFVARPIAHPVPYVQAPPQEIRIVVEQAPAAVGPVEVAKPSKAVPWALIAVALCVLVFSIFAAWHTLAGPQLQPVRSNTVDLVSPSR